MAYFESVNKISFEGKDSKNPFAFKHYNPEEVVAANRWKNISVSVWLIGIH